jgi:hypothetical protein
MEFIDEHGAHMQSYPANTTEVNVDYIIKQFDARLMSFYLNKHYNEVYISIPGRRALACSFRSPRRSSSQISRRNDET